MGRHLDGRRSDLTSSIRARRPICSALIPRMSEIRLLVQPGILTPILLGACARASPHHHLGHVLPELSYHRPHALLPAETIIGQAFHALLFKSFGRRAQGPLATDPPEPSYSFGKATSEAQTVTVKHITITPTPTKHTWSCPQFRSTGTRFHIPRLSSKMLTMAAGAHTVNRSYSMMRNQKGSAESYALGRKIANWLPMMHRIKLQSSNRFQIVPTQRGVRRSKCKKALAALLMLMHVRFTRVTTESH